MPTKKTRKRCHHCRKRLIIDQLSQFSAKGKDLYFCNPCLELIKRIEDTAKRINGHLLDTK